MKSIKLFIYASIFCTILQSTTCGKQDKLVDCDTAYQQAQQLAISTYDEIVANCNTTQCIDGAGQGLYDNLQQAASAYNCCITPCFDQA
jgi:hypothetical protein